MGLIRMVTGHSFRKLANQLKVFSVPPMHIICHIILLLPSYVFFILSHEDTLYNHEKRHLSDLISLSNLSAVLLTCASQIGQRRSFCIILISSKSAFDMMG